jgi:hypothetical protein
MEVTAVRCGRRGTRLDERPDTPTEERTPCPNCGSTARQFEAHGAATVGLRAALSLEHTREFYERHHGWTIFVFTLDIGSLLVGYWLVGLPGLLIGLAVIVVTYFMTPFAGVKVREITRERST